MAQVDSTARSPMTIQKPTGARRPPYNPGDYAKGIGNALNEAHPGARKQILRIIKVMGHMRAGRLLQEALALDAGDGMLTNDGSRRRTRGGIYLWLAKRHATDEEFSKIWPWVPLDKRPTLSEPVTPAPRTPEPQRPRPVPSSIHAGWLAKPQEVPRRPTNRSTHGSPSRNSEAD